DQKKWRSTGGGIKYINVKDKEASFCVLQIAQKGTKHPLVSDERLTIRKKFKESPLTKTANKFKTAVPSRPKKVPWSEEEQAAVKRHLGNFIAMQKLPGREAIQATLKKERCLQKRNWRNVKDFVRNSITSRARKSGRGLCH
ncbi:putative M-phase phosphoprotein 8-like isoform X2, partial [Apostichopus japonicus]